mmetsp:Transcript_6198/g.15831  ORF Transcript_6198/g.15831 Transcript_6198/m.15831 type:complete len:318 (+) Transcript_6198:3497-4450(+)
MATWSAATMSACRTPTLAGRPCARTRASWWLRTLSATPTRRLTCACIAPTSAPATTDVFQTPAPPPRCWTFCASARASLAAPIGGSVSRWTSASQTGRRCAPTRRCTAGTTTGLRAEACSAALTNAWPRASGAMRATTSAATETISTTKQRRTMNSSSSIPVDGASTVTPRISPSNAGTPTSASRATPSAGTPRQSFATRFLRRNPYFLIIPFIPRGFSPATRPPAAPLARSARATWRACGGGTGGRASTTPLQTTPLQAAAPTCSLTSWPWPESLVPPRRGTFRSRGGSSGRYVAWTSAPPTPASAAAGRAGTPTA